MTAWLNDDEQRAWRAFLHATGALMSQLEREMQADHGLSHAYYEVLVHLSEAPGRTLRMSELADASRSSRSRLSHAVARLESSGWVVREACEGDRRGQMCRLTDEGFAVLERAAPSHVDGVRRHLFDQLDASQVEQLRTISEALVTHLDGSRDAERTTALGPGATASAGVSRGGVS